MYVSNIIGIVFFLSLIRNFNIPDNKSVFTDIAKRMNDIFPQISIQLIESINSNILSQSIESSKYENSSISNRNCKVVEEDKPEKPAEGILMPQFTLNNFSSLTMRFIEENPAF